MHLQQMPQAFLHLQKATRLNPQRPDYAAQWARILVNNHHVREALAEADRAYALLPEDPLTLDTLGVVYTRANAHERAAAVFRIAVEKLPAQASLRFNLATALTFVGDLEAAEREYEACLKLQPNYWKAHLALSQVRKQTDSRNHIESLKAVLEQAGSNSEARLYLNLALEKEFDDLSNYDSAFLHLRTGKAAWRQKLNYTIERDQEIFDAIISAYEKLKPGQPGCENNEPIFVMGMPRTGTTLVDRILSSHPDVYSAGELQNFAVIFKRASGSVTPPMLDTDTMTKATRIVWSKAGSAYIHSTRPATGNSPRFVDKLPHNFLYAGFIAASLPRAKLVCLRRNPMDTCVSNFRQLFALTSPYYDYSFDLLDTGRYYLLFDKLMSYWKEALPGKILEVEYEDLVENQLRVTEKILDHCGLEWNDACLRFEQNEAPVATASAVQVRSPIYKSSLQRWKRYESQVTELRQLLVESGLEIN